MISKLMLSSLSISRDVSTNISDIESGRAYFLMPLNKQTRCPTRVKRIHNKDSQYSTSTHEKFLQNIMIENRPIDE